MDKLTDFVQQLPKAELHIHLEGSLEPQMMFDLAQTNNIALPYETVEDVSAAYNFTNLQDFLDIYYAGTSVLRTPNDFFALADAYIRRTEQDNVHHIECFFDPQAHTERGISLDIQMQGLSRAVEEARGRGTTVHLILSFLRHLSEKDAFEILEAAETYKDQLLGVGLDSSEVGHPPSKFQNVFAAARDMGLKLFAHAGEEGPPEYVWEALDLLGVDRIDHGNRALEDEALVKRLVKDQIPLTVCPLSNLKLCVVPDLKHHPLKRMLDKGLLATINSDDPAYFGGYMNENYIQIARALNLTEADLTTLAQNSFTASFD